MINEIFWLLVLDQHNMSAMKGLGFRLKYLLLVSTRFVFSRHQRDHQFIRSCITVARVVWNLRSGVNSEDELNCWKSFSFSLLLSIFDSQLWVGTYIIHVLNQPHARRRIYVEQTIDPRFQKLILEPNKRIFPPHGGQSNLRIGELLFAACIFSNPFATNRTPQYLAACSACRCAILDQFIIVLRPVTWGLWYVLHR